MAVCRFCDARVADDLVSCPKCGAVLDLVRHAEEVARAGPGAPRPTGRPPEMGDARPGPRPHPGIAPQTEQQLANLVAQGEILQAIKAYRQLTGASLAEAKDYIDSFPRPRGSAAAAAGCSGGCLRGLFGCLGVIVFLVCALTALALFFG